MSEPRWIPVPDADDLEAGACQVVKSGKQRIALFRADDGELYAVDNQCPHEGYPLAKGELAGCVLTCKWHNFKFDVRDGKCLMGDEPVRTYAIRRSENGVEIEVSEPPPEVAIARLWPSLERGLLERKIGQVARDVVRLLELGVAPKTLAMFAARFDARYAEWGTTHVLPVALDVQGEAERRWAMAPSAAALPLMQLFELAADTHTRQKLRPTASPIDPGSDPRAAGERFADAVEGERRDEVEGLIRGAIARGWGRDEIEPWLYETVCRHFLDFGHAMIYQVKIFDLLERCGFENAEELLVAHAVSIVNGTRENTLPEWSYFETAWKKLEDRAAALHQKALASTDHQPSKELIDALCFGEREAAIEAMTAALESGLSLAGATSALVTAGCQRILRFDVAHDANVENQHDWLDVTHTFTYASALRGAVERYRDPRVLRALYFGVRFVNVTGALDASEPPPPPEPADPSQAWEAILADVATRPIVVAHLVKVLVAAGEEAEALASDMPLRAAGRLLSTPIRERRVGRVTHEAIRLVTEGKVPRTFF